jgi:hypothetical protein
MAMAACGGGGGDGDGDGDGSTPTDPNKIFSLNSLQSTTPGTIYTSQLTGSDTEGESFTGSINFAVRTQEMLNGILVTPSDLIISLSSDSTASTTVTTTGYIDTDGNLIELIIQTTGVTCTPVTPDKLPDSIKIGDFGILSTLICSDNTTQERNWRVEDASNGNIRIVSNGTIKNENNTFISTTDITYTIDGNGNIIGFKSVTTLYANNYTLTTESMY